VSEACTLLHGILKLRSKLVDRKNGEIGEEGNHKFRSRDPVRLAPSHVIHDVLVELEVDELDFCNCLCRRDYLYSRCSWRE
jgi:hypothetical protein